MKKSTMMDVAKLAGVSQSTVSFVLNNSPITISEEAKQRIYNAVEILGYAYKARSKKNLKPAENLIVLMIPNASNYFYMELVKNMGYFVGQKKYSLFIVNTNRNQSDELYYLNLLCSPSSTASGIIYGFTPSVSDFSQLAARNIPLVVVGEMDDRADISLISLDSRKSGEMVTNHLLKLNHREIVYISSPTQSISLSRGRRLSGIELAIKGKGDLTVLCGSNETEFDNLNYEVCIGYDLTMEYFRRPNPSATAFIGANDMIAFGIIKALNELRIQIPHQVSVCGFDNILFSSLSNPSLTTVDHFTYSLCSMAVDILDNKIKKKGQVPSKIKCEPALIVRDSSGPAPGKDKV